jgi:rhodanese-related sulfurtransferase
MQTISESEDNETNCSHLCAADLQTRLMRGDPIEIIDVREFVEFAAGHIASARLVPLSELEARAHELDHNIPLVCVCRSGKRSAQAVSKLLALGFHDVAQLDGGVTAWQEQGFPLTSADSAPWPLERQVRFSLGFFVLIGLVLSLRWPAAILISWVIGAGMMATSIINWCGMALLLAKAPWNKQRATSCRN